MAKAKGKGKGKKAAKPASGGGGFGAKPAATAVEKKEDPKDLLRKSTDAYDALKKEGRGDADDDDSTVSYLEYALAIRVQGEGAGDAADSFGDWVPVAVSICKCSTEQDASAFMPAVVGSRVREIVEAACSAYPALRKSSRNCFQYSFENLDSWTTHVQNGLSNRKERRQAAMKVLEVEAGASAKTIKNAHRVLMLDLHPDRFVDDPEGAEAAQEKMLAVQEAYAELGGGQGDATGSAYAAIGGKGRVDFSGQLSREQLGALGKKRTAEEMSLELGGWRAGVAAIMEDLTQEFIARNLEDARARRAMQEAPDEDEDEEVAVAPTAAAEVNEAWSAPQESAAPAVEQEDIDKLCDLLGGCTPEQATELLRQGGSLQGAAQMVGISLD